MARERPLDYFPAYANIRRHKKTRRLRRLIGDHGCIQTHWLILELFLEACEEYPDGHLEGVGVEELADICLWPDDPVEFGKSLIESGWIEDRDGALWISNWHEYGGRVIARRVEDRRRKRSSRGKSSGHPTESSGHPQDVLRTSDRVRNVSAQTPHKVKVKVKEKEITTTDQPDGCQVVVADEQSARSVKIQTVWTAYREYHPQCAGTLKSSRKEYKLLVARLGDDFSVPQLIQAIHGYHTSPHHCGQNESGTVYQSFELIMRDSVHVENGIRYANGSAQAKPKTKSNYLKSIEMLSKHRERDGDEDEGLRQVHDGFAGILSDGSE